MSTTDKEGRVHIDDEEVRGATNTGVMRYVLGISLLLAAAAMTIAWVSGALHEGEVETAATMTGEEEATEANTAAASDVEEDTDGVRGLEE